MWRLPPGAEPPPPPPPDDYWCPSMPPTPHRSTTRCVHGRPRSGPRARGERQETVLWGACDAVVTGQITVKPWTALPPHPRQMPRLGRHRPPGLPQRVVLERVVTLAFLAGDHHLGLGFDLCTATE